MSTRTALAAFVCSLALGIVTAFYQRREILRLRRDNELLAGLIVADCLPKPARLPDYKVPDLVVNDAEGNTVLTAEMPQPTIRELLLKEEIPPRKKGGSVPRAGGYLAPLRKDPSDPHPDNTCWTPRTYDPPSENPDLGREDA
jgi:hypothetical protein